MLRKLFPTLAAVLLFTPSAHAAPPTTFTPRGIGGGGAMYSPTINPGNPKEMSIGCDMSPQFTTTDGGKTWTTIDFRQLQGGHDSAIRYTKDPQIRWSIRYMSIEGDDLALPARTTDGGKTWHHLNTVGWPLSRKAYSLYADYDNPDRAVVAAYREIYITLDGGKSFTKKITTGDNDNGTHLAGAFFDGDTIHLGLHDGLYTSTDGGKTFGAAPNAGLPTQSFISSFVGGKSNNQTRLFCVLQKKGWAGITGEEFGGYLGVFELDQTKKTWVKKTNGIPNGAAPFFIRMAANDADTAYVAGGYTNGKGAPCVFKTTNAADSWTDVFQTDRNKNIAVGWAGDANDFGWSFPEYALGFEVSQLDKNRLLITDLGCAHASDDGGQSWRQVYTAPATAHPPGQSAKGESFASNGMEVTSVWQVHWFDEKNLFACATDIRGFRSADAGKTWSFKYTGHTLNTMYHAATDPSTKITYAAVSSVHDLYQSTYLQDKKIDNGKGAVLATTDNGQSWKPVGNLNKPVVWVAAHPRIANNLYASVVSSTAGGIYMTTDADKGPAATWTKLVTPLRTEGHPHNIHILDDGTLICTFSGRRAPTGFSPSSGVFLSADNGKTWQDRTDFRMRFWTRDLVLDPADKSQSTWYACVFFAWGKSAKEGESGLYRTTDRGKTWTQIADNALAPSKILNVESCAFDPAHPGQFYMTTEQDGLFFCPNIRRENPAFEPVNSYHFKHPLRVQFNPTRPTEIWITSFGNAIQTGETTP